MWTIKATTGEDQNNPAHHLLVLQTKTLEKCINKICRLLAVGFGEAGGEIIAANLTNSGDLNPMLPGRKIIAIFGFCDIREFTAATEVLQVPRGVDLRWLGRGLASAYQ